MSTISRRDFMKTAGVMTLVAAASTLVACSTNDSNTDVVTPEEQVHKDTNDETNAKKTYVNGDSAAFGYYNHVITARTKLYKTHRNGDPSTFNAILGVQIAIHSSESITQIDKATYYGATSTSGILQDSAAHKVTLDVDVDGTALDCNTNTAGKIQYAVNSNALYAYQDGILEFGNGVFSTDTADAKAACWKEVVSDFVDDDLAAITSQGNDWVVDLAGKDISKGGESIWMLFNIPLTKDGPPNAKTVNVKFYNNNYMVASAPIKFAIPQTATDINFAYTGDSAFGA